MGIREEVCKLADKLRDNGFNFVIVVEDGDTHSQIHIGGESKLRNVSELVKSLCNIAE